MSAHAEVRIGDISDIGNDESFDVALLNVTIDIHESVALRSNLDVPVLIVAGILDGEQAERAARPHGRVPTDRLGEDGWVALVFDRGRDSAPTCLARWLASMFPTARTGARTPA